MQYYLKQFLESSTIHGLVYISTASKFARFFWILVVITGFTIATLLINDAFVNWSESPIKTTIETRPISEITFPKVTVCPPKNTFTDLNYDLMMLENMTMANETRKKLLEIAESVFLDSYLETHPDMANISKLEEENRFSNWYDGYTKVEFPLWSSYWGGREFLKYNIWTSATSGSIKTQYFGDKYDPDKIERKVDYDIFIFPPSHVVNNPNYTLTLEIEKVPMIVSGVSYDDVMIGYSSLDPNQNVVVQNFTAPTSSIRIRFPRDISQELVDNITDLETMPGFQLTWNYNQVVEPDATYKGSNAVTDVVKHFNFLKTLIQENPLDFIILTLNRLYIQQWSSKLMKKIMDHIFSLYPDVQLLTGEKVCDKNCNWTTIDTDLTKMQSLTNHPVHIVEKEETLSSSALIPFCWVGTDSNIGDKIDQFTIPVCRGFEKTIRNDQLCFELDPEGIIKNANVKNGIHLIVDDNHDRIRFGSQNYDDIENVKKLKYKKEDENEGIKVFLDAIGYHIKYNKYVGQRPHHKKLNKTV